METKIVIARSFTRKLNLGNYESTDLFASRSIELPADTPEKTQKDWSEKLFEECRAEVMEKINEYKGKTDGFDFLKVGKLIDNFCKSGNMGTIDEYENLTEQEEKLIQSVKRLDKRYNKKPNKDQVLIIDENEEK
jgi:hypothetical protein